MNASLPVGKIAGQHGVSPTGAATYTIPIELTPATAGMAPSLSINYNSQGGDGTMGIGWGVSGMSAITRTGKTIIQDGEVGPITWDNTCNIALDGARLMLTSGSKLTSGAVYGKEIEDWSKVYMLGNSGTEYFDVYTKGGMLFRYGYTADSRVTNSNGDIYSWLIHQVRDLNGNYYQYNYTSFNGEKVLSSIQFTGNDGAALTPYWTVHFHYKQRTDANELFVQGLSIKREALLRKMTIEHGTEGLYRSFYFNYAFIDQHSLLREITQADGPDEVVLNSTEISEGKPPVNNFKSFESINDGVNDNYIISSDFDGDGITDLLKLYCSQQNPLLPDYLYDSYELLGRDMTNNFGFSQTASGSLGQTYMVLPTSVLHPFHSIDFDGDSKSDLVLLETIGVSNPNLRRLDKVNCHLAPITSGSLSPPVTIDIGLGGSNENNYFDPEQKQVKLTGDFDGDGKGDILLILRKANSTQTKYCHFISDGGNEHVIIESSIHFPSSDHLLPIDFNGDGKVEILRTKGSTSEVLELKKTNGIWDFNQLYTGGYPTEYHKIKLGDFNGDGATDLMTLSSSGWAIGYSDGVDFDVVVNPITTSVFSALPSLLNYSVGDFNGDGLSDILALEDGAGSSGTLVSLLQSTGTSFVEQVLSQNFPTTSSSAINYLGDFNADGKLDLLHRDENINSMPMDIIYVKREGQERMVSNISDGCGLQVSFDYKTLSSDHSSSTLELYEIGTSMSYPLNNTQMPMHVVYQTSTHDGISAFNTSSINDDLRTRYKYYGATIHRQGRGFLGFEAVESHNLDVNTSIVNRQERTGIDPLTYLPSGQKSTTKSAGTLIAQSESGGEYVSIANDRYWYKTNWTQSDDYINGASSKVEFSNYSATGDAGTVISKTGLDLGGGGNWQHKTTTTTNRAPIHILCHSGGKITSTTTTDQRFGAPPVSATSNFTYYSGAHQLETKTGWAGTNKAVTTTLSNYNAFGLAEMTTVASSGLPTIITEQFYDSKGRYVLESKNPLGQSSFKTYHELNGRLASSSDIHGNTTGYTYDAHNRLEKVTDYLGNIECSTLKWELEYGSGTNTTEVENAWYSVQTAMTGTATTTEYFDILGRSREVATTGLNGLPIHTITTYNNRGLTKATTTPFDPTNGSAQPVVTSYGFDPELNRPTSVTIPGGGTTNYTYENGIGTIGIAKHSKVKVSSPTGDTYTTKDMTGQTTESEDDGGTLDFIYDSWGNLVGISNGSTMLESMTYDAYGRQLSLNPSGSGIIGYSYNAYGQLETQTDPDGNIQTFIYDLLGRTTQVQAVEGNTDYTYVTSGNGLNKLESVIGFNGISKSYEYDSHGRLSKELSMNGYPITCEYLYDALGRNWKKIYSTGHEVFYEFDANGIMESIGAVELTPTGSNILTLATADVMNTFGQYKDFDLGNGENSIIDYNEFGMPKNYYTSGIQDLKMDWYIPTGNLTERYDAYAGTSGIAEKFSYDNLQRLTSSQLVMGGQTPPLLTASIDPVGDYVSKHDAGSEFTYNGQFQAHLVKNDNSEIPLAQQQVSYTTFNEPDAIDEGSHHIEFTYGPEKTRMQTRFFQNGSTEESELRHYVPEMGYEVVKKNGLTHRMIYVPLFGNTMAILRQEVDPGAGGLGEPGGDGGSTTNSVHYVYKDHLGSWLHITDDAGNIEAQQNFDPWGRRRDPINWSYTTTGPTQDWLIRGYTTHEHLDEVGIVHMNGRLYDPIIGRMFSPDNFVQSPFNTQSYNRYAYAFNNPLKFSDPSGEIITWSVSNSGFSIGFNLTPIGVPAGAGVSFGWRGGFSAGPYIEVGPRVGGTGFGTGATISLGVSFNFQKMEFTSTSSASANVSFGPISIGASDSYSINHTTGGYSESSSVNAGLGLGYGNGQGGVGFNVGYSSDGFSFGLGGFHYADPRLVPREPYTGPSEADLLAMEEELNLNRHHETTGLDYYSNKEVPATNSLFGALISLEEDIRVLFLDGKLYAGDGFSLTGGNYMDDNGNQYLNVSDQSAYFIDKHNPLNASHHMARIFDQNLAVIRWTPFMAGSKPHYRYGVMKNVAR